MSSDHRDIGRELGLFAFSPLSPGNAIWLPNGNTLYTILQDKIRRLNVEYGYQEVRTPVLWKKELYEKSGHWEFYKDNMFGVHGQDEDVLHVLKPMNCPGHMEIYGMERHSYNELPIRMADHGLLHRDEVSGALTGLSRCRSFCQDDAHLFVSPEQIPGEISNIINMVKRVYEAFGMPVRAALSTRPKKFMGEPAVWDKAEQNLRDSLGLAEMQYSEAPDGAFYGPKIDFSVKDSLDREWQTATVQLDFQLPERFDLKYVGPDDQQLRPVVIHRAIYGSFERFIGIILEHYKGRLPPALCPTQAVVLPISVKQADYANRVHSLIKNDLRAIVDAGNSTLQQRIAVAQGKQIPFMIVVGGREAQNETVAVRYRNGENNQLPLSRVAAELSAECIFNF